jgi:hypothetical protein
MERKRFGRGGDHGDADANIRLFAQAKRGKPV